MNPRAAPSLGAMVCCLMALACQAPQAPAGSLNAAMLPTCAPWDGAAVAVFITAQPAVATYPEPPYVAVTIYRSLSEILNQDFDVNPGTQNIGQGQICPASGECRPASAASVGFRGLEADSTVDVTYRVEVAPDSVVTGRSRARLYPALGMCR